MSGGDQWSLSWDDAGVHTRKTPYYGENRNEGIRTNEWESAGNERSENLPQHLLASDREIKAPFDGRSGLEKQNECEPLTLYKGFNAPFDIAKNGGFLIAAIYENEGYRFEPSKQFAIVDLEKQKIVQIIETEYNIVSLAWAPDSKDFAVLYRQDVTEHVFKGPVDWLAELCMGERGYWTFYLTVYRPDGVVLCSEQIEKKLPNAMSYIDWK